MRSAATAGPHSPRLGPVLAWMGASGLAWTLVALVDVGSFLYARSTRFELFGPMPPWQAVLVRVVPWCFWWFLTPAVFLVANRFRFERGTRVVSLIVHLAGAVAAAELNAVVMSAGMTFGLPSGRWFVTLSVPNLLVYVVVCSAAIILGLRRRERDRAIANALLEAQLAQARLQALTTQLRPHFLYNALNSVAMQIRAHAHDAALELVLGYGELLRAVLHAETQEVTLGHELVFISRYLALERIRFPERLSTAIAVGPGAEDALIPNLILQPLVENALLHGLRDLEAGARLEIRAARTGDRLRLEVRDNGVGLPADWRIEHGAGVGLRNTRARLRERYGDACHFELHSPEDRGTAVIMDIPYQTAAGTPRG
jgi:two-component system LytT family sensor kinase